MLQRQMAINDALLKEDPKLMDEIINEYVEDYKNHDEHYALQVIFSVKNFEQNRASLFSFLDKLYAVKQPHIFEFFVTYDQEPVYNHADMVVMEKMDTFLVKNFNSNLLFPITYSYLDNKKHWMSSNSWKLSDVMRGNADLNLIANEIRMQNLSPYERYLAAYAWVTSYIYCAADKNVPEYKSRRMVEVIDGKYIVCLGYTNLLYSLLKKLDIPSIPFFLEKQQGQQQVAGANQRFHARSLVRLHDNKYNIHGIFVCDPTADAKLPQTVDYAKSFLHHLLPIECSFDNYKISSFEVFRYILTAKTYNSLKNQKICQYEQPNFESLNERGFLDDATSKLESKTVLSWFNKRNAVLSNYDLDKFSKELHHPTTVSLNAFMDGLKKVYTNLNINYYEKGILTPAQADIAVSYMTYFTESYASLKPDLAHFTPFQERELTKE